MGDFKQIVDRNPVPLYSFREFTFAWEAILTTTNGAQWGPEQVFGTNRLVDPTVGAATVSVLGFDQVFPGLYRRFKPYSTRFTVTFYDPSEDGISVCAYFTNAANPNYTLVGAGRADARSSPYSAVRVISDTGSQRVTIGGRMPLHYLLNVTQDQYKTDLDSTTGSFTGDPAASPYFKLTAAAGSGTTSATVRVSLSMSLWVMCYDRTNLILS
jgi:hypothetical protein